MDRKIRVLQICHDFKGPFRTIPRQYSGCFADCDVRTVFLRGPQSADIIESIHGEVEFLSLGQGALRGLKLEALSMLETLIGDEVPDIVIAHRYKPFYLATLLNRKMDIGLVLGVMHEYGFLKRKTRSWYSRFWQDNVELLGVSEPLCLEIEADQPHLRGRVHCLPHAIEASSLLDSVSARHQLGVPLGRYCYGVIGRLVEKKNHAQLLEAVAELDDDVVLALVGDGPLKESLMQLSEKLRLGDKVVFCGHHENARRLMKAFDCLVLPSTHEEAFGMVLLEAMAASTPVLSTDAPGPASVVGDAGVLFKSGDLADMTRGLRDMKGLSRDEEKALTARALERLGKDYSVAAQLSNMRTLPRVAEIAPITS